MEGLDKNLLPLICVHLSQNDIGSLMCTNTHLHHCIDNNSIVWKQLLSRRFKLDINTLPVVPSTWKSQYFAYKIYNWLYHWSRVNLKSPTHPPICGMCDDRDVVFYTRKGPRKVSRRDVEGLFPLLCTWVQDYGYHC